MRSDLLIRGDFIGSLWEKEFVMGYQKGILHHCIGMHIISIGMMTDLIITI